MMTLETTSQTDWAPDWAPDWATHPGEHLAEYLDLKDWQAADLARALEVSPHWIKQILAQQAAVTPDLAEGLEKLFDMKAYLWLNLQTAWDQHQQRASGLETTAPLAAFLRR